MLPTIILSIYCIVIVLASLLGGWLPTKIRLTHRRMQFIMSFVGGMMLGVGMFQLLPHAQQSMGSVDDAMLMTMIGLLTMFFLIRIFHFHQHVPLEDESTCDQDHDHDHSHSQNKNGHDLGWLGVGLGLALHTALDGVALAAAVKMEHTHNPAGRLFGLGIFLAIALHKPLDAMTITAMMMISKRSALTRQLVNAGFAMMCPLGAAIFLSSISLFDEDTSMVVVGGALAFSAGVFFCISLGDILPEVQFHRHDRIKLSLVLLLGIAIAWGVEQLHSHDHKHPHQQTEQKEFRG